MKFVLGQCIRVVSISVVEKTYIPKDMKFVLGQCIRVVSISKLTMMSTSG